MSRPDDYETGERDTWAPQGMLGTVADAMHLREEFGVVSPVSGDKRLAFDAGANRDLEGPDA